MHHPPSTATTRSAWTPPCPTTNSRCATPSESSAPSMSLHTSPSGSRSATFRSANSPSSSANSACSACTCDGLRLRRGFRRALRPGLCRAGGRRLRRPVDGLGAGFAGDVRDLEVRIRGAKAAVAARHGRRRTARLLRADRTRRRIRPRRDENPGATRWFGLGAQRPQDVDHQRLGRRRRRSCGPATDDGIRGFIVPTDTPGFTANTIHHKLSLRASITSELVLDDVRLPADAMLPEARGCAGRCPACRRPATESSGARWARRGRPGSPRSTTPRSAPSSAARSPDSS